MTAATAAAALRIGSLCSGYRGLDMAVEAVFGGTTAWVSDIDPGANQILDHRWPSTPNIGDLTVADWAAVEPVDIVCGGYPCQPFSTAGLRKGTEDERHIWPYIAHALGVLRPRYAIFENVAGHLRRGFDTVLADLARLGFDVEWACVRADEVGAPHQRRRLFIVATAADAPSVGRREGWPESARQQGRPSSAGRRCASAAHADGDAVWEQPVVEPGGDGASLAELDGLDWGAYTPAIRRWEAVAGRRAPWATGVRNRLSPAFVEWLMGLPAGHVTDVPGLTRTQQLHALGNGVVPQQAAAALRMLHGRALHEATEAAA